MTYPWEKPEPRQPGLTKDANGLFAGQQHPLDIPDFLKVENRPSREANLLGSSPRPAPPSQSKCLSPDAWPPVPRP